MEISDYEAAETLAWIRAENDKLNRPWQWHLSWIMLPKL